MASKLRQRLTRKSDPTSIGSNAVVNGATLPASPSAPGLKRTLAHASTPVPQFARLHSFTAAELEDVVPKRSGRSGVDPAADDTGDMREIAQRLAAIRKAKASGGKPGEVTQEDMQHIATEMVREFAQ